MKKFKLTIILYISIFIFTNKIQIYQIITKFLLNKFLINLELFGNNDSN